MDSRQQRILFIALSVALAAMLAIAVLAYPSGGPDSLPEPLETVSPAPGSIVVAQTEIVIEFPAGYEASLVVDGIPIPAHEVVVIEATGTVRWRPGPESVIYAFEPGEHSVEVSWDRRPGSQPDPGVYAWTFRVT